MSFLYDWFSHNISVWEKFLKKYKNKEKLLFLEIGCFEGKSTLWLLENILTHPSSKIVVIDTFEGGDDQKYIGLQTENLLKRFKANLKDFISEDSKKNRVIIKKGFSGEVLKSQTDQFDFIYIDGSHIAKDVLEDAVLSWDLLKVNGTMIFDDYGWDCYKDETLNPKPAINCFLRTYRGWYKILHAEYQVIIQKKSEKSYNDKKTKRIYEKLIFSDKLLREVLDQYSDLVKFNKIFKDSKFYKVWEIYCDLKNFLRVSK